MPLIGLLPAIIGGVGSIIGGITGASAAHSAANTQASAADQVAGMATTAAGSAQNGVQGALNGITANLQPYLQAGNTGVGMLTNAVAPGGSLATPFSFDASQIAKNPAYQFQLQQGLQALQNSAAARGISTSGGTMKGIMDYAQSLAGTAYNNIFNQQLTTYQTNRNATLGNIQQLLGLGTTGTSLYDQAQQWAGTTSGQFGLQGAEIAGNAITGGANAKAAGDIGAANAYNSMLGGLANAAQTGYLNYTLNNPNASGNSGLTMGVPSSVPMDQVTAMNPGQPLPVAPTVTYAPPPVVSPVSAPVSSPVSYNAPPMPAGPGYLPNLGAGNYMNYGNSMAAAGGL